MDRPTIFALASGRPPAALAVVRISGARARGRSRGAGAEAPEPRRAALRKPRRSGRNASGARRGAGAVAAGKTLIGHRRKTWSSCHLHSGRAVETAVLSASLGKVPGPSARGAGRVHAPRVREPGGSILTAVEGLKAISSSPRPSAARAGHAPVPRPARRSAPRPGRRGRSRRGACRGARSISFRPGRAGTTLIGPALHAARQLLDETRRNASARPAARQNACATGWWWRSPGRRTARQSPACSPASRKREVAIVSPHAGTTLRRD